MKKITIEEKNRLINQRYNVDSFFNPVQDVSGSWFISDYEIKYLPPFDRRRVLKREEREKKLKRIFGI